MRQLRHVRHQAGSKDHLTHLMRLDYDEAGFTTTNADAVCIFIELWCETNCIGSWRLEQSDTFMLVSFETVHDRVHFQISREFLPFEGHYKSYASQEIALG